MSGLVGIFVLALTIVFALWLAKRFKVI